LAVRLFVAGLLACLALASCGRASSTTTTQTAGTIGELVVIAAPPDPTTPPASPAQGPRRAESRDDLVDEARTAPHDVWGDPDDPRVLHVRFTNGVAPCFGARVAVDEGPATVRVLLFTGRSSEGFDEPCYTIAVEHEIVVSLARPLGTREVIW
jgi:hypothetical protein